MSDDDWFASTAPTPPKTDSEERIDEASVVFDAVGRLDISDRAESSGQRHDAKDSDGDERAKASGTERCPICMQAEPVATLACGHAFCESCLLEWARRAQRCPICQADFKSYTQGDKKVDTAALLETQSQDAERFECFSAHFFLAELWGLSRRVERLFENHFPRNQPHAVARGDARLHRTLEDGRHRIEELREQIVVANVGMQGDPDSWGAMVPVWLAEIESINLSLDPRNSSLAEEVPRTRLVATTNEDDEREVQVLENATLGDFITFKPAKPRKKKK